MGSTPFIIIKCEKNKMIVSNYIYNIDVLIQPECHNGVYKDQSHQHWSVVYRGIM